MRIPVEQPNTKAKSPITSVDNGHKRQHNKQPSKYCAEKYVPKPCMSPISRENNPKTDQCSG
ncbi:hypothetical protein KIN20_038007 [Parelaphostrongylus tenuis]|uniref:Uncharacterized protein n=1 Tax=Parelaphostrongylus tenuis TaxID=148309 RepID=A0AAD5RFB1_PARTN|nr:hypothetical protein KIN20_038007 [Parelaphostrongylus tenuis]